MSKYIDLNSIKELDGYRKEIFLLREQAYKKHKLDLLDNDTLSALSIYEIVTQYDPGYNINFSRNGEDAKSGEVFIEQKSSRIELQPRTGEYPAASFQFHAMGNIEYDRYIFATRDKPTLDLIRIYDIKITENTKLVQTYLLGERAKWENKNKELGYTQKRDVIVLPEGLLISNLVNSSRQIIAGCEVILA